MSFMPNQWLDSRCKNIKNLSCFLTEVRIWGAGGREWGFLQQLSRRRAMSVTLVLPWVTEPQRAKKAIRWPPLKAGAFAGRRLWMSSTLPLAKQLLGCSCLLNKLKSANQLWRDWMGYMNYTYRRASYSRPFPRDSLLKKLSLTKCCRLFKRQKSQSWAWANPNITCYGSCHLHPQTKPVWKFRSTQSEALSFIMFHQCSREL